jgi:hypothetical protein
MSKGFTELGISTAALFAVCVLYTRRCVGSRCRVLSLIKSLIEQWGTKSPFFDPEQVIRFIKEKDRRKKRL